MSVSTQRLLQCTVCGYNQAGHPHDPPTCPQHPDRYLIAQKYLVGGPKDFLLGAILSGKYVLTHALGQGQYGRVYHALQLGAGGLKKSVAVKILREDRAEAQALFLDEMKVISQLSSPNIVRYLDSGFDAGQGLTYMVMEVVNGDTLAQLIESSIILKTRRTINLIAQLLIALDEAHQARVVHRDLKPSNLMLTEVDGEEVLKVLDFGVARPDANRPREQTQGVIPGTPAYMAPELFSQYNGQVSPQMDLFSVGVIFYQCLTGHLPFDVEGNIDHLIGYYKLYSSSPRPMLMPDNIPKEIQDLILCALSLDPKRRFNSARDMLKGLTRWSQTAHQYLEGKTPVTHQRLHHKSGYRTNKMRWFMVAAVLGGALGLGAHLLYGNSSSVVISKLLNKDQKIEQSEGDNTEAPSNRGGQMIDAHLPNAK
jgi:serine/threonine protein kinase